jgi:hypothetical protein
MSERSHALSDITLHKQVVRSPHAEKWTSECAEYFKGLPKKIRKRKKDK